MKPYPDLNGNGKSIMVGEFEIRQLTDGSYYIEHDSGEGCQISAEQMEKFVKELYDEVF